MTLVRDIEAILFVAGRSVSIRELKKHTDASDTEIEQVIEQLKRNYNTDDSGILLISQDDKFQLVTNPDSSHVVEKYRKNELDGDLTKAQLETLTVIAYQGPITKPELEEIRGVNCALILRNLLLRGLIEERDDNEKLLPVYSVSFDTLAKLGVKSPDELPDYDKLHQHEYVQKVLETEET